MPTRPKRLKPGQSEAPQHLPRETAAQRGYGYRWQQARLGWLRSHPLCIHCEREGRVVAGTDVDHIVPHKGDMVLFWDFEHNIQSLCHSCHSKKTVMEDGGFGNKTASVRTLRE